MVTFLGLQTQGKARWNISPRDMIDWLVAEDKKSARERIWRFGLEEDILSELEPLRSVTSSRRLTSLMKSPKEPFCSLYSPKQVVVEIVPPLLMALWPHTLNGTEYCLYLSGMGWAVLERTSGVLKASASRTLFSPAACLLAGMWEFPSLLLEGESSKMKQQGALCAEVGRMLGVQLNKSLLQYVGREMASAWKSIQSMYQWILDNGDKRTDPWLLVYSPVPVLVIILGYLCVLWAGPRLMKHREPVDLKVVLIIYNFAMVCLSVYMFHEFLVTSWLSNYSYLCQPVDYSASPLAMRMASVCWWFFFSKVIELSDTVFFILRKKNSQLTFLHVYHHGTMVFNWWLGVKYLAGGQSFFIGLLNSFVHTVMYSYYGLASLGPRVQRYLWWKRYLTSLQLLQFVLLITHTVFNLFTECDFSDSMNMLVVAYCLSLIVLFSNFYYQSYCTSTARGNSLKIS